VTPIYSQPIGIERRFTPDADLDPATKTPVGEEGFYLYILNEHANWDYSTAASLVFTMIPCPSAYTWYNSSQEGI
jgi:hypothetical protein